MSLFKRKKKELPVLSSMESIAEEEKPKPQKQFITPHCSAIGEVPEPQVKKKPYITVDRDGMECYHFTFEEIKEEE